MSPETFNEAAEIVRKIGGLKRLQECLMSDELFIKAVRKNFGDDLMDVLKEASRDRLSLEIEALEERLSGL